MAEPETTKRFEMYLSGNDLIPVTDPTKIDIMRELTKSDRTLADLSRILGVPLSTLFSNLNKMVDDGLIESYSQNDDKRKVMYTVRAFKIMESRPMDIATMNSTFDLMRMTLKDPAHFYRNVISFFNLSMFMSGLDVGPLYEHAGVILADMLKEKFKSSKVEELIPKLKDFADKAGMPQISVFTFVPLTIVLQIDFAGTVKTNNLFKVTAGFIREALINHTGVPYHITSSEIFGENYSKMKFILEPDTAVKDKLVEPVSNVKRQDRDYFEMFLTLGGIIYNSNNTQLRIMRELELDDATLSDLARRLDVSQSTIFANLNKMVDDGLIVSNGSDTDNRKVVYSAASIRVIKKEQDITGTDQLCLDCMSKAASEPQTFFRCMFQYLIYNTNILGLNFTDTASIIGMFLARAVREENPTMTVEQLVKMICENSDYVGAKSIKVETYIPLTIEMGCYLDNVESVSAIVKRFYEGLFSTLLTIMSGTVYKVTSTKEVQNGEITYKYILESSPNTKMSPLSAKIIRGELAI